MDNMTLSPSLSENLLKPLPDFPITVLLIDDQKIVAVAIKKMLSDQHDISFFYCSDSKEALRMIEEVKPTVILQDLVMPDVDGLTLVKIYREMPSTLHIPIIVLSSKEEPQIKAKAFALGANDYVVKLPDRIELIARIRYHSISYIRLLERNAAFKKIEESQKVLYAELADAAAYVRSLLPPPFEGDLKINWLFIPSTQLGGDAFGYHWLDDKHFAIYLLDVCGHGVGAALHSISVINVLRSYNLPRANFFDPSSVLRELNQVFRMENHNNMFLTIWYGVYNKETHQIVYATGGHPPAILITGKTKETAKILELKAPGMIIGAFLEAEYENAICQVLEFNRLFIFSDGPYEILKPDETMMTLNEFIMILKSAWEGDFDLDFILKEVQNIQGKKEFLDDVSLLEVEFVSKMNSKLIE